MLTVHFIDGLEEVDADQWDAVTGSANPFVEHAFLHLLETSGSVGADTGWLPRHVVVEDNGQLIGAAPTYIKDDSYGEYIFDWSWAEAAAANGLPYYPKIVVGVPFTPATGPRLMVHPDADVAPVRAALIRGLDALCESEDASGVHLLFGTDAEASALEDAGYARRATHQYHWFNDHYADFDAFLAALRSSARKQIRKERKRVAEAEVQVELHPGAETTSAHWSALNALYRSTYARKWGRPYLTPQFFEAAKATIGHRALVGIAHRDGEIIAGTLSFEKGPHLYGRYWGAFEPIDGLHFELCYYQLIEHAIDTQKTVFEAGAQGQHKVKRGFVPVRIHSAHQLAHPGLHSAIARHVALERMAIGPALDDMASHAPYHRGDARGRPRVAGE